MISPATQAAPPSPLIPYPGLGGTEQHPYLDTADARERIGFCHEVASWCLRHARRRMQQGDYEGALSWTQLAARRLIRTCRPLVSEAIERNLLQIAAVLPAPEWRPSPAPERRRWLHVLDHALPYGGLTAMARRWMERDAENASHSVAFTAIPKRPIPSNLAQAVQQSGGAIFLPAADAGGLARASWLRQLAWREADRVVLHIDPDSVIAPAAFGVPGGPPVLLVNHAAHIFWTGASVADLVINCRGSEFEQYWTRQFRGVSRCATLPIPIPEPECSAGGLCFTPEYRRQARQLLGIPSDAVVLLSVGREEKYRAVAGLDFYQTFRSFLQEHPSVWLLVAGPEPNAERAAFSRQVNGRILTPGCQTNLRNFYAAADIYVESFPFGSTTALLEAGVHGLPCVLAPADCPPPFGTDGLAIDHTLQRPSSLADYLKQIEGLIEAPAERLRCGHRLRQCIRRCHCGEGWKSFLSGLVAQLPPAHSLHPAPEPPSPPEFYDLFWTASSARFGGDPFFNAFLEACEAGLAPALDPALYRACRAAKRSRHSDGKLQSCVPVGCAAVLHFFPAAAAPLHGAIVRARQLKKRLRAWQVRIGIHGPLASAEKGAV